MLADSADRGSLDGLAETLYRGDRLAEAAGLYRRLGKTAMSEKAAALGDVYRVTAPRGEVVLTFEPAAVLPVVAVGSAARTHSS